MLFLACFVVLLLLFCIFSLLFPELRYLLFLVLNFLLKVLDIMLLISRKLVVGRRSNVELQEDAVL